MQAVRLTAWGRRPVIVDVPVPVPVPARCCSRSTPPACATPTFTSWTPPPGHASVRAAVHARPRGRRHGRRRLARTCDTGWQDVDVVVHGIWGCGSCRNCRRGRENYCARADRCDRRRASGATAGSPSTCSCRPCAISCPPGSLPPSLAAPLTDAGLTAFHAIRAHEDVLAGGGTALVVGVGGLGHLAVQLLRSRPDEVVVAAVDTRAEARALAARLGAQVTPTSCRRPSQRCDHRDRRRRFDLVLDFVGDRCDPRLRPRCSRPRRRLRRGRQCRRSSRDRQEHRPAPGVVVHGTLLGTAVGPGGCRRPRVGRHRSRPRPRSSPLSRALEVYELLRQGRITGRAVLVP